MKIFKSQQLSLRQLTFMKCAKWALLLMIVMVTHAAFAMPNIPNPSATWNNYLIAQIFGTEPILPNFSFAGYKYSEEGIPTVNYKVFDVTDYGADGTDTNSDKVAIKAAIAAAVSNGEGIVYFPKGKYYINTASDDATAIEILSSNIVLRGEGDGEDGSILFFENALPTPGGLGYTVYPAIQGGGIGTDTLVTTVTSSARRETSTLEVADASGLSVGDWVILQVFNNDPALIEYDIQPLELDPNWWFLNTFGVRVNERHQIESIDGNVITFVEPIHYDVDPVYGWEIYSYTHVEEIGVENLRFEGNWTGEYKHLEDIDANYGWMPLGFERCVNCWVRDSTFKNVSIATAFAQSAYSTALNLKIIGNEGHISVAAGEGSTGILIANVVDSTEKGMWHGTGVTGGPDGFAPSGNVIWRCKFPATTSFESHGQQPRATLFDKMEGGMFYGRAGGSRAYLPNHHRHLVLWNYKQLGEGIEEFRFGNEYRKFYVMVPPIIVGFHGADTTFYEPDVQVLESLGTPVDPESLFEAQLRLRLCRTPPCLLPQWLRKVKRDIILGK